MCQCQYKKDARLSQEPAGQTSQRYAKTQEAVVEIMCDMVLLQHNVEISIEKPKEA